MTAIYAKSEKRNSRRRSVVFVIYPDITLLDLTGPLQVFSCALKSGSGAPGYSTAIVSVDGGDVETDTPLPIRTDSIAKWARRSIHTLVVVGGDGAYDALNNKKLVRHIGKMAARANRVCSVCSGALLLAAAGLLDGRRVVTHWEDCDALASMFPEVQVDVDPIFVKDGNVWTSAGVTAGIDMSLAIVAEDLGRSSALRIARVLVTYMVRPGGQLQFSPALHRQALDSSGRFDALHDWIANNLQADLRVERLADQVNMSSRNFSRIYSAQIGQSPAKAVEAIRTEAACQLLQSTSLAITTVATRCGFSDAERMRRAFMRTLQTTPRNYRRRFQIDGGQTEYSSSQQ